MATQVVSSPSGVQHSGAPVKIGMIGCGTVGQGVLQLLAARTDCEIVTIAVRSPEKHTAHVPDGVTLTTDPLAIATHPDVDVVVEVAGSVDAAFEWISAALNAGKPVVTANKDCMATHGDALRALAEENNVALLYEAAVAAGIPLVLPLKMTLAANRMNRLAGILNGTCNYILTRMSQDGWTYAHALEQAQARGFAEADPTNDVGGKDTAYKLAILTRLAFGQTVKVDDMWVEGIDGLSDKDMALAHQFGFVIKLLGMAQQTQQGLDVRVHPVLLPKAHPLASVSNEYNALWAEGHAVGELMFYGRGAGELPTASGVCGDVLLLVSALKAGGQQAYLPLRDANVSTQPVPLLPKEAIESRYYIRLVTHDHPGVVGKVGTICGNAGISLESIVQHGVTEDSHANIVLMTHTQTEGQCRQAVKAFEQCEAVESVACVLRVMD